MFFKCLFSKKRKESLFKRIQRKDAVIKCPKILKSFSIELLFIFDFFPPVSFYLN